MVPRIQNRAAKQRKKYNKPLQQRAREPLRGKTSAPHHVPPPVMKKAVTQAVSCIKREFSLPATKLTHTFHRGLSIDRRKRRGGNTGRCFHISDAAAGKRREVEPVWCPWSATTAPNTSSGVSFKCILCSFAAFKAAEGRNTTTRS